MSNRAIQNVFVAFQQQLNSSKQPLKNRKAIHAITHCRTREMGVSVYTCKDQHKPVNRVNSPAEGCQQEMMAVQFCGEEGQMIVSNAPTRYRYR